MRQYRRDSRAAVLALAVAVAFLAAVASIVAVVVPDVLHCSPPSDTELAQQEAFVRAHVVPVWDVRSGVGDCDDAGRGYVDFTTSHSPAAVRDAFLADSSCADEDEGEGDVVVRCRSGKKTVDIILTPDQRDRTTTGELSVG